MSTAPVKVGRGVRRDLDVGPLGAMVESFELHLLAERKSPKTIRTYIEAALWFAASYLLAAGITEWDEVTRKDVQHWVTSLAARYGKSGAYASNQFRALQQFFKWHATEDPGDPRPNPMAGLKPPKVDETEVPVFTDAELAALLATCKGGGFENRRDHAILSLFRDTGMRLAELAGLDLPDVSLRDREALVTGKGPRRSRRVHDAVVGAARPGGQVSSSALTCFQGMSSPGSSNAASASAASSASSAARNASSTDSGTMAATRSPPTVR